LGFNGALARNDSPPDHRSRQDDTFHDRVRSPRRCHSLAVAPLSQAQPGPGKGGFTDKPTSEQLAFFEKKIRPVLVESCYKCHSADAEKIKAG